MAEYIDREALLAHLRECKETSTGSGLTAAVITAIQSFVEGMPAADVAPVVHGRWIRRRSSWYCSNCGKGYKIACGVVPASTYNCCPVCRANMDGKEGKA